MPREYRIVINSSRRLYIRLHGRGVGEGVAKGTEKGRRGGTRTFFEIREVRWSPDLWPSGRARLVYIIVLLLPLERFPRTSCGIMRTDNHALRAKKSTSKIFDFCFIFSRTLSGRRIECRRGNGDEEKKK